MKKEDHFTEIGECLTLVSRNIVGWLGLGKGGMKGQYVCKYPPPLLSIIVEVGLYSIEKSTVKQRVYIAPQGRTSSSTTRQEKEEKNKSNPTLTV